MKPNLCTALFLAAFSPVGLLVAQDGDVQVQGNWISWRGPLQTGVSLESYENFAFNPEPVWSDAISGAGTPVIFNGRIYSWGFRGEGSELMEVLQARDEKTGEVIWEAETQEFMSDTVYNRYVIGAPTVDPETGNIYLGTTYGLVTCYSPEGEIIWQHSMVERFGRLTFPNGRAGAAVVDDDILIIRGVTSYWGADGPARDRFFGFDKLTGDLLWSSTPGVGQPFLRDTSFSTPFVETRGGKRVFYVGTGCGNIVCINLRDGTPIWRFQMSMGGINSSPIIHGDRLLGVHGKENLDTTEIGRMFAIDLPADYDSPGGLEDEAGGAPRLPADREAWRSPIEMFTSSPLLHDGRLYQLNKQGTLHCVDAENGKILWELKVSNSQLHASPAYADGKLFVPTFQGKLFVIDVTGDQPNVLHEIQLEGNCNGSPAICNGRVYVHSSKKLYAFEIKNSGINWAEAPDNRGPEAGAPAKLMPVPADVLLTAGGEQEVKVRVVDANGNRVGDTDAVEWAKFIPPTARVKSEMDAAFADDTLRAAPDANESAGAWKGTAGELSGLLRGRVLSPLPYQQDFEAVAIGETGFAFPPLAWIGARMKWEIREIDGNKVLAKTLDSVLFQRALTFIGDPEMSEYVVEADVMTDGNRRLKSVVGLINQRYVIALVGNTNVIEVSSNHDHFVKNEPFPISANQWYTLKTRVDLADDGSGVVRAKAWKKGEAEPEAWTIEAEHRNAHAKGAPGLYGFSPQAQKSVFIDNISVTDD